MPVSGFPKQTKKDARGTWQGVFVEGHPPSANFGCPLCAFVASLRDHSIDATGLVTPSVACPGLHCNFHEHIKLNGWKDHIGVTASSVRDTTHG